MYVDLHMHSTASDGRIAPGGLAELAVEKQLSAIALTDHDSTDGLLECAAGCRQAGIDFVPGIEISAERGQPRGTLHILGYFIDPDAAPLLEIAAELQEARDERAPQIVEKLNALGVDVTLDEVLEGVGGRMIGRPHIASVLVDKGYAKTINDAFGKYIGQGAPAYVRKDRLAPQRAIDAIHTAGGLACLAHPVQMHYDDDEDLLRIVTGLKEMGLDGIEVYHKDHTPELVEQYQALARRYELVMTGGSDYHGPHRPDARLGSQRVPREIYDALREAHARL